MGKGIEKERRKEVRKGMVGRRMDKRKSEGRNGRTVEGWNVGGFEEAEAEMDAEAVAVVEAKAEAEA